GELLRQDHGRIQMLMKIGNTVGEQMRMARQLRLFQMPRHGNYKPKKKTAVAFAIALKLDLPTMEDLLSRAEIAFSPSNKFDLIITYCVNNGIYDIFEINAIFFKYGQPILGE
ncbi:MAG: RNase III inhibitor, partial [Oscillospiraceae bacterium]|nr:RNase III inhibitor [Oscillospiraceae bacterium]